MNVLYLTINPNRQSTTVPTEGWFRCLRSRGLRPVLVSHEEGEFQLWAQEHGIATYHVPLVPPSKANPLPFARSLWKLRQIVRKHRIELVHCNEQDCYLNGSYLARWTGLPVVVSVHFRMERQFCEWVFGGRRRPDRMFFVSQRNLEQCESGLAGVVEPNCLRVLHNGLDMGRYAVDESLRRQFREAHCLGSEVAIGVGCALRPRKQLEHLFAAAAQLETPNVKVLLAGGPVPGDERYAAEIVQRGRESLGSRFVYLGHVDDLRPLCNGLDLFVNTSQEESFGIAVLEAMACGCPVVGYDSKAVDEVVLPQGGEIVAQDDIGGLTNAISRWVNDSSQLARGREKARHQAEQFDICRISDQLWQEYDSVLSTDGRRRRSFVAEAIGTA